MTTERRVGRSTTTRTYTQRPGAPLRAVEVVGHTPPPHASASQGVAG